MTKAIIISLLLAAATLLNAQEQMLNPLEFPILLSGNFGELRPNHFHSGIDLKTQGVEGKNIRAVEDGYISRIAVSPWGFGNVIYIIHPNGLKTVYGHLQKFAPKIAAFVKQQQYEQESFSVDLDLPPDAFPVTKGEIIALSGNSGSSGGPHLHFEIRNAANDKVIDPLIYYKELIKDTRPPQIQSFLLQPLEGEGTINGANRKAELKLQTDKNGHQAISGKAIAWGKITIALKAYDYMDGTTNIYGVSKIAMAVDGKVIFNSAIDSFSIPNETRYINSFTDPQEWREKRSFYMKSSIEPGNRLNTLSALDHGIISIDEERPYNITYLIKDAFGNQHKATFQIEGRRQAIAPIDTTGTIPFHWKGDNRFAAKGIRLTIPDGNLYSSLNFKYTVNETPNSLAPTHRLHNKLVTLHNNAKLSIRIANDTLDETRHYGIVRMNNNKAIWIGGEYRDGWINADIRELGDYTVMQDRTPPTATPVNPKLWTANKTIALRIADNLSGIQTYRGEIDGKYALFELDGKRSLVTYAFDGERIKKGAHRLTFTITDACGNSSFYDYTFTW